MRSAARRGERRFALALFLPAFLLLVATTTLPLVYLVWSSTQRLDLSMPWMSGFAGLANYAQLGADARFWSSLWLTFVYTGTTVALQVLIGLGLALLVLQVKTGQAILRIGAILPIVLAPVVAGLFWRSLVLAPDFGIMDFITRALGLGSYNWLGDPQLALVSVIAIHTWQWTPFAFLVLLASLAALPPDLYEAARLDRAGPWQRFRHITLPTLRPTLLFGAIITSIGYLQFFEEAFVMTSGGPLDATRSITFFTYDQFGFGNHGYAAAASYLLFLAVVVLTFIQFKLLGEKD